MQISRDGLTASRTSNDQATSAFVNPTAVIVNPFLLAHLIPRTHASSPFDLVVTWISCSFIDNVRWSPS